MSTNWLHDLFFGSNESAIKALEKLQQMDAEQFQKVFSALEELQKSQIGDATQFKEVQKYLDGLQEKVETLEELQKSQIGDATQFKEVQKYLDGLQEKVETLEELQKSQIGDATQFKEVQKYLDGLQEKVETLTETVADQEKTLLICAIVSAVAAIAITSFVAFCIYQGVKLDKEKKNDLSKDTSDAKLNNADDAGIPEKLDNSTVKGLQKSLNDIAA